MNLFIFTVNWVDHSKTLREQGIDESEILLLRRKYFFSDQNIDSTDPVQLGLLYVQVGFGFSKCDYSHVIFGSWCSVRIFHFLNIHSNVLMIFA